jgi:hypothetical protein
MAAINTEIENLKSKIAYRRKMPILQNLRRKNAGEEPEFYIIIEKNIPPVSKKTNVIFLRRNIFSLAI